MGILSPGDMRHLVLVLCLFTLLPALFTCNLFVNADSPSASPSISPSPVVDNNDECPYSKAEDKCAYVKEDNDCQGTLVPYLEWYACNSNIHAELIIIYVVWTLLLFYLLATTADSFFCPCLQESADLLRLGPRMAGVTLLSLGNGAPDVFSAIAAVGSGNMKLVLGDLSGAGMFVCSIVAGGVIYISGGLESRLWHLKDVLLYLVIVVYLILILHFNWMTHAAAGIMLGYYGLYVALVFFTERSARPSRSLIDPINPSAIDLPDTVSESRSRPRTMSAITTQSAIDTIALTPNAPLYAIVIHFAKEFLRWLERPFVWMRYLTIVLATKEDWDQRLASLSCCFSLVLIGFWQGKLGADLGHGFPLGALLLIMGCVLGAAVYLTSTTTQPPKWSVVLLLLGFINSAVWINMLATELVEVLTALGHILNISQMFLGATVLAWGNSVGDLTADLVMAKNKRQATAIAACYAGPLFNILIGLGIGVLLRPSRLHTVLDTDALTAFTFLCVTLALTSLAAFFMSPVVPKYFAFGLGVLYCAFMVTVLVQEFQ